MSRAAKARAKNGKAALPTAIERDLRFLRRVISDAAENLALAGKMLDRVAGEAMPGSQRALTIAAVVNRLSEAPIDQDWRNRGVVEAVLHDASNLFDFDTDQIVNPTATVLAASGQFELMELFAKDGRRFFATAEEGAEEIEGQPEQRASIGRADA